MFVKVIIIVELFKILGVNFFGVLIFYKFIVIFLYM